MNFSKRANRILLLLRCQIRDFFYGQADKVPSNISKIIVVPTGKLGDVVCCTPIMRAIRHHLPEARIIVAGNSKLHEPLLADSGLADEYLDLHEDGIIKRIKKLNADAAIVTGPSFEYTSLFFLAGIPMVVGPTAVGGVAHDMTRPYRFIQKFIKTFPHELKGYAPRERLKSLEPIGIHSENTKKHLGFSKEADKKAKDLISKIQSPYKYLVGISAGAGNKEKQWDPKNFAKVANNLIKEHGAHIIVFGGKHDASESLEMITNIENKAKISDATNISIDDLKALISKLDVFISVNTGPLYIAEAFDVCTVDILGPVNPWDQPPQGRIHKMVFPPGRPKPLLTIMNTRNHDIAEAEKIAQSTLVEDVIGATKEAIEEVDKRKTKIG